MKRLQYLQLPLTFAFVAILATSVFAQDTQGGRRGGQGGPGQGGGPGGGRPGGGFGGGGGGDPIIGLLQVQAVREEIEMAPDQEEALTKLRESAASDSDRVDFRSLSEAEQAKYLAERIEKRKKSDKEMREKLEEVLLPEQLERVEQISIQVRGTGALADETIAAKLKVTADQKAKLEEVRTKNESGMRDRMREIFSGGSGDRDKMREELTKIRKEMDDEVFKVLTADQRKQFEEMKGKPFEMPEGGLGRGGFGGGGGGGAPGAGGRPGGDNGGGGRPGGNRPRTRPAE